MRLCMFWAVSSTANPVMLWSSNSLPALVHHTVITRATPRDLATNQHTIASQFIPWRKTESAQEIPEKRGRTHSRKEDGSSGSLLRFMRKYSSALAGSRLCSCAHTRLILSLTIQPEMARMNRTNLSPDRRPRTFIVGMPFFGDAQRTPPPHVLALNWKARGWAAHARRIPNVVQLVIV